MQKISTPFAGVPAEVDEQEAEALERMGLTGTSPAAADSEPEPVEVDTVFGRVLEVSPDEAASLRRQGLAKPAATEKLPVRTPPPPPEGTSGSPTPKENG